MGFKCDCIDKDTKVLLVSQLNIRKLELSTVRDKLLDISSSFVEKGDKPMNLDENIEYKDKVIRDIDLFIKDIFKTKDCLVL